jgi:hypothetical protein
MSVPGLPRLPAPRGEISAYLCRTLTGPAPDCRGSFPSVTAAGDPLGDDDLQLSLYLLYELHYRGFAGVAAGWEWSPVLLDLRSQLEAAYLGALCSGAAAAPNRVGANLTLGERVGRIVEAAPGPSLSRHIEHDADWSAVCEYVVHRSLYHLKEADPYTWALPRLAGRAKVAMAQIQLDEYGSGRPEWNHAALFAQTLRALGLDDTYGAYLDAVDATTLATVNVISLFGLHRRWRGALIGHLAVTEMTSPEGCRRIVGGLRRLGAPAVAALFYEEHVEADAMHDALCRRDLLGGITAEEPEIAADVLFGVRSALFVESRFAARLMKAWQEGRSSLRREPGFVRC